MLGDDRVGRRLVPPQSISGHAIRDRLHLVRSEALELRRVRRQKLSCVVASCFIAQGATQTLLARNVGQGGGGAKLDQSVRAKPSQHESYKFKHPYLNRKRKRSANAPLLGTSDDTIDLGLH